MSTGVQVRLHGIFLNKGSKRFAVQVYCRCQSFRRDPGKRCYRHFSCKIKVENVFRSPSRSAIWKILDETTTLPVFFVFSSSLFSFVFWVEFARTRIFRLRSALMQSAYTFIEKQNETAVVDRCPPSSGIIERISCYIVNVCSQQFSCVFSHAN